MGERQEGDILSTITISKVIHGVTKTLSDNFPAKDIYVEEIPQNLNDSFFVKLLEPSQEHDLGRRYIRQNSFDIHYFASDKKNMDMHDIAEQLYSLLSLIEIDGIKYHGTGMRHEIVNQVLHFFVSYNFHVYKVEGASPKMQQLEQEGLIGG